ncbi:MAG: hypothetical protein U0793_31740 [Gemmataceae bacterium]
MQTIIQVSKKDSAKAWGILVRHSPGQALPERTFVLSDQAVRALREAGVRFKVLSSSTPEKRTGAVSGERI